MTGIAAKPAYVIRTPTASITVRGTIFDVYVQSSGMSWLLLIEGAIEVCNARDDCRLHDEPGKLIRITPDGNVGSPVRWVGFPKDGELFESAFPFVITPPQFDSDPVFTPDDIVGGTSPDGTDDGSGPKDNGVEEANDDPGTVAAINLAATSLLGAAGSRLHRAGARRAGVSRRESVAIASSIARSA